MPEVEAFDPPVDSLLAGLSDIPGIYLDCFKLIAPFPYTLQDLVLAFYTTPLFKAERTVLRFAARRLSTDAEALALASGHTDRFAIWKVEDRRTDEILLGESSGRTKSWLGVAAIANGTELMFGSAVLPVKGRDGQPTLGPVFHTLLGAHKVYSRALLAAAGRGITQASAG